MTHTFVYPNYSRHSASGHLEIDGCSVPDLVELYGTPLFIYGERTIRERCREYVDAFSRRTDDFEIIYASKAFSTTAVCRLVYEEGLSLDVSSGGEYHTARAAGVPGEKLFFHGNNKTRDELEYALESGVGFVVVDSLDELTLLEDRVAERGETQKILLRVTPGIEAHTHAYIQTGQLDSKFGFGLAEGLALEAIRRSRETPHLDLVGLHAHIGSQIFDLTGFQKAIVILGDLMRAAWDSFGFECRYLNIGGGLGIAHTSKDAPARTDDYAEVKVEGVRSEMERVGLPMPRVLVEPGRSIVGNAGVTAYRVGTVKEVPGIRTYVSVDGGMSDNLRPMLYGAEYEAALANRIEEEPTATVTIAGKHCESGDILIKDALIPEPRRDDILVMPATGGYCFAMASNYNGNPRPAVVFVREGESQVVVERESYEDLVAKQRPLQRGS